ncbi:MAG: metallophosphoesterase [Rhizobacter sp.]
MSIVLQKPRAPARGRWLASAVVILAVLGALVWHDSQDVWSEPGDGRRVLVKLSLYWALWLVWPLMGWVALSALRSWRARHVVASAAAVLAFALCACVAWGRFIEPNTLQVHETTLGTACGVRVALVSDLHLGLYTRQADLQRLIDRLNGLQVDAVLVAGDWTYEPSYDLRTAFAPLAGLRHRTLSVLGNHDEQKPGPPLKAELFAALAAAKVESIDGRRLPLGRCELEGLGDLNARSAQHQLKALNTQASDVDGAHRVVLTHNPDTSFLLAPGHASWLLSGHTHGGQINLPILTASLLARATQGGFAQGIYNMKNVHVFVTSGVGIDKLPLRFRVPPTIDVLGL